MGSYILRRLLLIFPTLLGISIATFFLLQMVPGGPVEQAMLKLRGNATESGSTTASSVQKVTQEELEYIKRYYGFDRPLLERYFRWLGKMIHLDFGESYQFQEPVLGVIMERLPISLTFGLISFILTYLVCIPLGVAKALKHGEKFDHASSGVIFAAYAIPGFALGIFLITFLASGKFLAIFPLGGAVSDTFEMMSPLRKLLDFCWHMILPVTCYVIGNFAMLTMLMKNSLMEELGKDYMKTALAKGLDFKTAVFKHAFRNALIPVATGIGKVLLVLFAGSLLVETVFNINGIGLLSYQSIINRDYPVVMGLLIIESFLALLGNLVSDLSYVLIDPRINFRR